MRFSVIIPAYNAEKYIQKCLDSVLHQDFPENEFEVIVVDDCSPDHLTDVVTRMQEGHRNLVYFKHSVNKRQGGGRNTGLKIAHGEYIIFMDADDCFLYDNVLDRLNKFLFECREPFILRSKTVPSIQSGSCRALGHFKATVTPNERLFKDYFAAPDWGVHVWATVYNRNFLIENNLWFRENVFWEDTDWFIKTALVATKLFFVDFPYYGYVLSENGVTRSYSVDSFKGNILSIVETRNIDRTMVQDACLHQKFSESILVSVLGFLKISRNYSISNSLMCFALAKQHNLFDSSQYQLSTLQRIVLWLLRNIPIVPISLVRLLTLAKRFIFIRK